MAQWLRICLPMQGTRVWSLVREDPTCRGATKPVRHNYWACALELWATTAETHTPRARAPQQEKPPQWEPCSPQQRVAPRSPHLEKARVEQPRPKAVKKKKRPGKTVAFLQGVTGADCQQWRRLIKPEAFLQHTQFLWLVHWGPLIWSNWRNIFWWNFILFAKKKNKLMCKLFLSGQTPLWVLCLVTHRLLALMGLMLWCQLVDRCPW